MTLCRGANHQRPLATQNRRAPALQLEAMVAQRQVGSERQRATLDVNRVDASPIDEWKASRDYRSAPHLAPFFSESPCDRRICQCGGVAERDRRTQIRPDLNQDCGVDRAPPTRLLDGTKAGDAIRLAVDRNAHGLDHRPRRVGTQDVTLPECVPVAGLDPEHLDQPIQGVVFSHS